MKALRRARFGWAATLAAVALIGAASAQAADLKPLPKLTLIADQGDIVRVRVQALQEMLRKNLGLDIEPRYVDFKTRLELMRNHNFDMVYAGWGPDYDDPLTFMDLFITGGAQNDPQWSNAVYDKLIETAQNNMDQGQRMEAMRQAEILLAHEAPIVPIYWRANRYRQQPFIKNYIRRAVGAPVERKWAYTQGRPGGDGFQYLNLNLLEEPPDLDPSTSTDTVSFDIINATYEGLVRVNPEGKIVKGSALAVDWQISPDGKEYVFKLRDAKWSNGQPVTANDFVYSWRRAVDPRTASQYAYIMYVLKNAEKINAMDPKKDGDKAIDDALKTLGVEALDAHTLKVTLEKPAPYFLSLTSFITYMPLPQTVVEKFGDSYAADANKMVANGPFIVTKWDHGYQLILEKNPTYWDAKSVRLQKIHFDMIADQGTAHNLYNKGQLDVTGLSSQFIPLYGRNKDTTAPWADGSVFYLEMNTQSPIFRNAKVRRAIGLAIDRQLFCDAVLKDGSIPATSFTAPVITDGETGRPFVEKIGKLWPETADVAAARQLFAEGLAEEGFAPPKYN
ncbi:MAG: hypothetical protein IMX01_02750 [Limnochordaceae bacterium]|nr:hypothetical protein [Limnochordaceae bacterium]